MIDVYVKQFFFLFVFGWIGSIRHQSGQGVVLSLCMCHLKHHSDDFNDLEEQQMEGD